MKARSSPSSVVPVVAKALFCACYRVRKAQVRVKYASTTSDWRQAQRVALARAIVTKPAVLLLDEPFSALDAMTRADLQDHLVDLWSESGSTMLLVTHDIEEAIIMADRIVVMGPFPGRVLQEVVVDLPRKRDRTSPAFAALRKHLSELLAVSLVDPKHSFTA